MGPERGPDPTGRLRIYVPRERVGTPLPQSCASHLCQEDWPIALGAPHAYSFGFCFWTKPTPEVAAAVRSDTLFCL